MFEYEVHGEPNSTRKTVYGGVGHEISFDAAGICYTNDSAFIALLSAEDPETEIKKCRRENRKVR